MKPVVLESPYAGDVTRNLAYLKAAIRDCLARGEAPYASHGLYPGALDDGIPEERTLGIDAGFAVAAALSKQGAVRVFYCNFGISDGMSKALAHAFRIGQPYEMRTLPGWSDALERDTGAGPEDVAGLKETAT